MNRVLVTGAGGFVGSAVARHALAAGFTVRAMVRSKSRASNLAGLDVEVVEADLNDAASIARVVDGCRYVFHVAADYRLWAPEPEEIVRTNVRGTQAIVDAVLTYGVERLVYTSSVATLPLNEEGTPVDESVPLLPEAAIGAYKKSKVLAERVVVDAVRERGLPAVIVNPSTPIGPRDARPTPTGRVIVEAASGKMPGYVDTGLNFVHVDDVAHGHLLALEKGRIGERYILGGQDVPLGTFVGDCARLAGRSPPKLKVPRRALYPLAYAAEAIAAITKREPFITVDGLHLARYRMYFTSAKAIEELGYSARPYQDAIRDAIAWFRGAGMLR
jgi:dihydroflavonol-4-reductase